MSEMSPENRDFSSWEYTGELLTPRQAEIFDKILLGQGSQEMAEHLSLSIATVKDVRRRIRETIERETGGKPKDTLEMISAMIRLGEVSYKP